MINVSDLNRKLRRAQAVGAHRVAQRLASNLYRATNAASLDAGLNLCDLLTNIPPELPTPAISPKRGSSLRVGWVMAAPGAGSGGHTTLFRMIRSVEDNGHRCIIFVYDKFGVDFKQVNAIIEDNWPWVRVEIRDATEGIDNVDAVMATSWESAHVLVKYGRSEMRRLYFIQDYEPYIFGHGAQYEFAAMTYRLPFRRIALGDMLDRMIVRETGLKSDVVPFGCDTDAYHLPVGSPRRSGVVFYSRPDTARRGYELGAVALRKFHELHPGQEINVFGAKPRGLDVPFTFHGVLSRSELNDLYGRTIAGLAMSFTNITLVAEEMLSAGNIPIVNYLEDARVVLSSPHVRWAEPTAAALARELSAAVSAQDVAANARVAAQSVAGRSWRPTGEKLVRIIEDEVYELA